MYNMLGMATSFLGDRAVGRGEFSCHKLATILPRYSILVPRHVAAKVIDHKSTPNNVLCKITGKNNG